MEVNSVQWNKGRSLKLSKCLSVSLCDRQTHCWLTDWLLYLLKLWLKQMFYVVCWWTKLTWGHSSALFYCTVFSVLLSMWQCVCCSYCRQLNAVSFSTDTSCCTVQIHIQSADWVLFRYSAGIFSVLLWMWQCVCCSNCRQLNAVSFSTGTSCCTVQIHIQSADLVVLRYIAGIFAHILNIPDSDYKLRHIWRSVRPSVRPSARNNSTPTACIFMNFDIWVIFEICREYSNFIKIWQACPVLHMNTGVHLWLYLIHLFLELEFFQTKFV